MLARARIVRGLLVVLAGLCPFLSTWAQREPATRHEATNETPVPDSDLFFAEYVHAARLVEQGGKAEAAILMSILQNKLSSTPWMEISLLKLCELVENSNQQQASDGYDLLLKRVGNAPFFTKDPVRGRFFGAAIKTAAEQGLRRVRLRRIRTGLDRYFARYSQYPENLARLAIYDFLQPQDILDIDNRPFRYLPTGQQFHPQVVYLRYELEAVRPEPFTVSSPRLESTTRLTENPETYAARINVPGRAEPVTIRENQTIEGYYVAIIARRGILLCTPARVVVLPSKY